MLSHRYAPSTPLWALTDVVTAQQKMCFASIPSPSFAGTLTCAGQEEWLRVSGRVVKYWSLKKKIRAGIDRNPVLGCDAAIIAIIH